MHISPISSYRGSVQNQQSFTGFNPRKALTGGLVALATLGGITSKGMAQTAKVVPDSISLKCLQFNPKDYKIAYLAPWTKTVTQEGLTADSLTLVNRINSYNKIQATPNGWNGMPVTVERAYDIINRRWQDFFTDKVRYQVSTGKINKPPSVAPTGVDPNWQISAQKKTRSIIGDFMEQTISSGKNYEDY